MSAYEIELSQQAASYLRRLDNSQKQRIASKLREVGSDWAAHSKRLVSRDGTRSVRVGDVRVLFDVDEAKRKLLVLAIRSRGDVYKHSRK